MQSCCLPHPLMLREPICFLEIFIAIIYHLNFSFNRINKIIFLTMGFEEIACFIKHTLFICFHYLGVYYCWLQGRRAAEIRLLVYLSLGDEQQVWSHPDFAAAIQTVFKSYAVMTALFCLLLICRAGIDHARDTVETHLD